MSVADRGSEEGGLLGGAAAIVLVGVLLGVGFNWLGLSSKPAWGLTWIAQDRAAELESLDAVEAVPATGSNPYESSDDPMAVPGGQAAAGLPEIPALERPVKIEVEAVKQLVDADAALLVDAREPDEYAAGHIPNAVSLPYDEVTSEPERLENLDSGGRPIIVYCGGGACELSLSIAWDLIYAGHERVAVYMGGYPEWESAGHPVSRGEGA